MNLTTHYKIFTKTSDKYDRLTIAPGRLAEILMTLLEIGEPFKIWRATKPDTDNMIKLLKDCMERSGFFKNDSYVVSDLVEKFWAKVAGIYIYLEELE